MHRPLRRQSVWPWDGIPAGDESPVHGYRAQERSRGRPVGPPHGGGRQEGLRQRLSRGLAPTTRRPLVSGVTLQPMIQNPDYEILLGAKKRSQLRAGDPFRPRWDFRGSARRQIHRPSTPQSDPGSADDGGDAGLRADLKGKGTGSPRT